ncbi:MAG: polysaccharide biosynthesis C-terminal domain-containing protein, partial [Clostridia bacterium]|nr:polysaccharide biosynthesis C-terminal domain-containing protein [Clostridia bacterium]
VSTVAIPTVSASKTQDESDRSAKKVLFLTALISIPCALFCFAFAPFIINFLFRALPISEKAVAVNLLRLTSPAVFFLSFLQTSNAVLIGKRKHFLPLISLSVGILIKIILNIILFKIPSINIYGGGVGLNACYFTACLINLFMIFKFKVKNAGKITCRREYAS